MKRTISSIKDILRDPVTAKRLYVLTFAAALMVLVLTVKGPEEQGRLLTDNEGNAVSIERHSVSSSERYDVTLHIKDGDKVIEKDMTITLRAADNEKPEDIVPGSSRTSREAEIDGEIDRMLTEIEFERGSHVTLPRHLADGTRIIWKARKQEDRTGLILIPFMYLVLAALIIKSGMDAAAGGEAEARHEIMRGLPRFCNQLFLMMNAGMILSDAFETICSSYIEYGRENMTVFERELSDLYKENTDHRISTASLISEYAARHNVKEMIRIAAILTENERRGSDVIESLSRESKYLWDDRKIVARESGKMIDTKMSWPLGLLLILLIVITIAPALLNM